MHGKSYFSKLLLYLGKGKEGNKVFGQVVGQSSFQLKAKDRNTLVQPQFGVKLVFERNENKMTLYQHGHTLVLRN